jgi:hypothetical protein
MTNDLAKAVSLPWMISTSVSDLRVLLLENDDTTVTCDVATLPTQHPCGELIIRRAAVSFEGGQWLRVEPAATDASTIPAGRFSWGEMPLQEAEGRDAEGLLRDFYARWRETGICPDPGIYEIVSSTWLRSSGAARFGCKHYVMVGRDTWLEILAMSLAWRWADTDLG